MITERMQQLAGVEISEAEKTVPDLKDPKVKQKDIERSWPKVNYDGKDIFVPYMTIQRKLDKRIKDHFAGYYKVKFSGSQEVYLGYNAKKDVFICGFDIWRETEYESWMESAIFELKFRNGEFWDGKLEILEDERFYPDVYQNLKRTHGVTFDLRLD